MARRLPEYRFLDHWHVAAPVEHVYDVVGDVLAYPRWWGDVFLSASGDEGPPAPGRRTDVVARGFLPYKLRFSLTCSDVEPPLRIASVLDGDFEGSGTWLLEGRDDGTTSVALDWRPRVAKPLVRTFTPVLRPAFRANHDWTMVRGERHIAGEIARRFPAGG